MRKKYNILVTGSGGDIGQSIGKILNQSDYVDNLYGCDISGNNAGRFIYSNFFLGLPCSDLKYVSSLEDMVKEKNIDLVIPVSEPEIRFLSRNNLLDHIGNAKLLTASSKAMEVGFDKLETADFLKKVNLPYPITKNVSELDSVDKFPVIIKSKTGSGSSKIYTVKNQEDYYFIKNKNPDFIVQEHLDGENGEYTCGLFRSKDGIVRSIILRRELTGGYSGYGEVIENKEIEHVLTEIATKLELTGCINVQLRLTDKGPVVFEINPRFSSTVLFRHLFGFKDLEWAIEDLLSLPLSEYIPANVGRKFFKGFNEYIL